MNPIPVRDDEVFDVKGVFPIDKPPGWTSFDVVNYIRGQVAALANKKPRYIKVGHTGTLDPLATGLLLVLVGKEYTQRADEWNTLDKTYEVTMRLGETSTTADEEGDKLHLSNRVPSEKRILKALKKYTGKVKQLPPAYSAKKVNGVRAYKLARAGKKVRLKRRKIFIYSNELISYEYPYVIFTSHVSSGTYIRTLCEDMGSYLHTGAYMAYLRRTKIGEFSIEDAVQPKEFIKAKRGIIQ